MQLSLSIAVEALSKISYKNVAFYCRICLSSFVLHTKKNEMKERKISIKFKIFFHKNQFKFNFFLSFSPLSPLPNEV